MMMSSTFHNIKEIVSNLPDFPACSVRDAAVDDDVFLRRLHDENLREEITGWGWDENQVDDFLEMQYRAREAQYTAQFGDAFHGILLDQNDPIGRIIVQEYPDRSMVRIVDIGLLPARQNRGIGTAVLRNLCTFADAAGLAVSLSVRVGSRAISLYERIGLKARESDGVYIQMLREKPAL